MFKKTYWNIRLLPRKRKEPYVSFYKILGFYPHDIRVYQQALVHKSSSMKLNGGRWLNNERLEFLGDAILDAIVADIVFKEFETKKEGFLTNIRSKIVQRETLNRLALEIGIDKIITTAARTDTPNTHMYGNALEALIGAIYLDRGYRVAKAFVSLKLIEKYIDIEKAMELQPNYKSRLIEWGQKHKIDISFELLESTVGENNIPRFISTAFVGTQKVGEGTGYSKKESQQKAAEATFMKLQTNNEFKKQMKKRFTQA